MPFQTVTDTATNTFAGGLPVLPHVGRSAELSLLGDWLTDVARGHGGMQFLAGPSGIGKTRLATALAARAERDGWAVAVGRVFPVESGVPYAVWSDALAALFGQLDERARTVLTRGGDWVGTVCPPYAGAHRAVVDVEGAGEGKARLLWNCAQFLTRYSETKPLLLVLENLQVADAASLELLHFVARQSATARLAVIATYNEQELDRNAALRDTEQSLLALGAARLMRLEALTQGDVEQLVCETFAVDHPPARQLARRLYSWTRGHPYFVEETLKSLTATGRLFRRDGHWFGWDTPELDLPRTVRAALTRRMEGLGADARMVAGIAAALGAHVRFEVLRAVAEIPDDRLLAALDELCAAGVLVAAQQRQAADYEFGHPMVQDVVYDSLGPARARLLHRRIANALEAMGGRDAGKRADVLAFHFARADGEDEKALHYLASAGRDALARHADRAAADYLTAALERSPSPSLAANLRDGLAHARQRLGEYDDAMTLWQRVRADAAAAGDALQCARVDRRMGLACFWTGRFEESLAHFESALDSAARAAKQAGDESASAPLVVQVRINRGSAWQSLGRPVEAERELRAALADAERLGDAGLVARAHRALLFLHVFLGPPETARQHGERALALAQEAGLEVVAWAAHYGLATLGGLTGDGEAALRHVREADKLLAELQSPVMRVHAEEILIQYDFAAGNWDAGTALAEQAIATARALNQRTLLPRLLVWATQFYVARGEYERAKQYLDEAWDLAVVAAANGRPVEIHSQIAVYAGLAAYYVATGDYAAPANFHRAVEVAEEGLALADRAGYFVWATYRLLPVAAEAAMSTRDLARADALLARMRVECERLNHRLGFVWIRAGEALIARLREDYPRARDLLRTAIADLEAVPWVYDAARLRGWLADVCSRLGDHEDAARELRAGHEVLSRLGAQPELERHRNMMRIMGLRLPRRGGGGRQSKLSEREMEIAQLVAARCANKEIAARLGISLRTVTTHVANIFQKLGISSRAELGDWVREVGDGE